MCGQRSCLYPTFVILSLALVPPFATGCNKSKAGVSHESIVVEAIASLNRAAEAANRVYDTASARQAEQSLRSEAQALRELQERLVGLGRPSGRDKKRANGHSQQLIDASESIKRAIASLQPKLLSGQVERGVATQLAKATAEYGDAMTDFAKVAGLLLD